MHLDLNFLKKVLPEVEIVQGAMPGVVTFSVDSRTMKSQDLFFALSGNKVDGHDFIKQALDKGIGVVLAHSKRSLLQDLYKTISKDKIILLVEDPFEALIALSKAWRHSFVYPVAAITGSIGKTSTKEMTAHILQAAGKKYLVSQGNLNTLIGVAITISHMNESYEGALFEVGISKQGEMEKIVELLRPTVGLITYIAHAHTQGLGTLSTIAYEKRLLFKYFLSDSIGIVNGDQALLSSVSYPHPLVRFGFKIANQIQARNLKENADGSLSYVLKIYDRKYQMIVSQNHSGIILNMLASVALSHQLGVKDEYIIQSLKNLPERRQRFQICPLKKVRGALIDDCYNASPGSVKAALLAFEKMKATGKKIVVLGDMLELGNVSSFWHRQIGRFLRKVPSLNHLVLVGKEVSWIQKTAPHTVAVDRVDSWQDAISLISAKLDQDALILVKGSRGMQLQNIVEAFVETK